MHGGLRSARERGHELEGKEVRVNGTDIVFQAELFEQGRKVGYWNNDKLDYDTFDVDQVTRVK